MMRPTKKTLRSPSCSLTAALGTVLLPRGGDAGLRVLLSLAVPEGEEVDSEPQVDCPVATLVHAGQTSSSGFGALSPPEPLSGLIRATARSLQINAPTSTSSRRSLKAEPYIPEVDSLLEQAAAARTSSWRSRTKSRTVLIVGNRNNRSPDIGMRSRPSAPTQGCRSGSGK